MFLICCSSADRLWQQIDSRKWAGSVGRHLNILEWQILLGFRCLYDTLTTTPVVFLLASCGQYLRQILNKISFCRLNHLDDILPWLLLVYFLLSFLLSHLRELTIKVQLRRLKLHSMFVLRIFSLYIFLKLFEQFQRVHKFRIVSPLIKLNITWCSKNSEKWWNRLSCIFFFWN